MIETHHLVEDGEQENALNDAERETAAKLGNSRVVRDAKSLGDQVHQKRVHLWNAKSQKRCATNGREQEEKRLVAPFPHFVRELESLLVVFGQRLCVRSWWKRP